MPLEVPNNSKDPTGEVGVRQKKPNNQGDIKFSGPLTKEVQRLQKHIEAKMADLAEEPNSRILRRDLRRLQDRLNFALNKAITASKNSHTRQVSLSTYSGFSQPVHDHHIAQAENTRKREQYAQRDHPVFPGEPIFTNYCDACVLEFHYSGSLPDNSVIGLTPRLKEHIARRAAIELEDDMDSLTVNRHRNRKQSKAKALSVEDEAPQSQAQAPGVERVRGRRLEPRKARDSVVPPETAFVSPETSYCPSRSTGSSGRREERKSSGNVNTDPPPHKKSEKLPRNYQAPYVEDSVSTAHSRLDSKISIPDHEETARKCEDKVCEPWKTLPRDFVLKSAMASDRSSSDGSRKARDETSKEPHRPREKSLDSECSDPSSSKSSGSKTVRFKQSVDIRTPLTNDGDNETSEHESPERLRAPGSPLISRQKPSYYNSYSPDRKTTDKYLHPHYGQSSRKSSCANRESLHTPDSFRPGGPSKGYSQGAFSKDFDNGSGWGSFRSPEYSYRDQYPDESPLYGHHETDEGFQASNPKFRDYNHYEQYMESTASLPSRLSSGSVFSAFFKKTKNKSSSVPPGDRASSYAPSHNFNETARDN
ncbi:hypothetical protein IL306_009656 [Fusarium sp. DS 682]|nr:hypothetical protein IL306_009656 [Fusarium sp. DS 682]